MPTLHIVRYFAVTDVFLSLHKPYPNLVYEFNNSCHANYKIISSKCCLGRTDRQRDEVHSCNPGPLRGGELISIVIQCMYY